MTLPDIRVRAVRVQCVTRTLDIGPTKGFPSVTRFDKNGPVWGRANTPELKVTRSLLRNLKPLERRGFVAFLVLPDDIDRVPVAYPNVDAIAS